jgi:hypothetical protein
MLTSVMGFTLGTKVHNSHVVEQRSAPLHRQRMTSFQEDGQGFASGSHDDLGVHLDVLPRLLPGVPCYRGSLPVLSTGQIHAERQLHWRVAADMLAPSLNPITVPRNCLGMAVDACLSANEIESDLLGPLAATHVGDIFVSFEQEEAGVPGARKACQPAATAQPGQSSPKGEDPRTNSASMSHSPPPWGGSGGRVVAVGAAVAVGGLDGLAVGSDVAVTLDDGDVGVYKGGGVSVGDGEAGLSVATVGEAVGNGVNAKLSWRVEVLVGKASAFRVLVGVGVTVGVLSRHWTASNAAKLAQNRNLFINREDA